MGEREGLDTFETVTEAAPTEFKEPPIEDQLAFHTLWPESHKLYGHGNELFSLCCDHNGTLVASSCKIQDRQGSIEKDARIKLVLALPQFGSSVTAVAWTGLNHKEKSGCVAVGMESGLMELWNIKIKETEEEGTTATAALALRLEPFMCHVSAVNRLAWRPTKKSETNHSLLRLTSCGADNYIRVFDFKF